VLAGGHLGVRETRRQLGNLELIIPIVPPRHDRAVVPAREAVVESPVHLHERLIVPGAVDHPGAPADDLLLRGSVSGSRE